MAGSACALDRVETVERFVETVVGDLFVLNVEGAEDGLVEHPALVVVASAVELLGVLE
ncbi:hypothetical protein ACWDSJ_32760 [Nocardia sp. NPDC003482]|uniref:hypothetical protein n=1 Tax=Nocardia TaxID=1817 RepID=UPI001CA4EFCC|nr:MULTISPECIES: hypothetical protein [Nocardia]